MAKPLFIECDASKKGIGSILLQPVSGMGEKDITNASNISDFPSDLKSVTYASKSLSDAETHYANIERELLAVVLVLLLCISEYDLKVHYQPGSKMKLSASLSRQSSHNTKDGNNTDVKGLNISIHELEVDVTDHKLEKIHITTQNNAKLQMLFKHIIEG